MARKLKVRSITVIGREWWCRRSGTTYCTVVVLVNGAPVANLPSDSGYGEHYVHRAHEWLAENGFVPPIARGANGSRGGPLSLVARDELKCAFYACMATVPREKDL